MGRQKGMTGSVRWHLDFASTFTYTLWEGKGMMGSARGDLDFASTFTYFLWEGKKGQWDQQEGIWTLQAHLRTSCGKAKRNDGISRRGSGCCKHIHIHTVGRQKGTTRSARRDLNFATTFTYILWESKKG
jgi:hypothetical protein